MIFSWLPFFSLFSTHFVNAPCHTAGIEETHRKGKISSLIGVEGGHSIGTSLGVLRMLYQLGARYLTLTHTCNTPWADCCKVDEPGQVPHIGGLSKFGFVSYYAAKIHNFLRKLFPCLCVSGVHVIRRHAIASMLMTMKKMVLRWISTNKNRQRQQYWRHVIFINVNNLSDRKREKIFWTI